MSVIRSFTIWRHRLALVSAVLLLALAFGCGGSDDPVEPEAPSLDNAMPATASATSLARVYLDGLPDPSSPEDYQVLVAIPGEEDAALLVQSDDIGPYFHAPLHPVTPNAGGSVMVRITDGAHTGPEHELMVDALPEAPGAFEAFVTALRAHIEQRAVWAGTSFDELAAQDFDEVDPLQLPLKVAQYYIESDEPGALTTLIENPDGFLTAEERELLDRLMGYAPVDGLIQSEIDSFTQGSPSPIDFDPLPRAGERRLCVDLAPPISNAEQLSQAMIASAFADIAINPNSAPGRTLSALGTVLLGGSALPTFGKIFSALGAGVTAWENSNAFLAGVLPSLFGAVTYDLDRDEWDEDQDEPGTWSNVKVIASSIGWSASGAIAAQVAKKFSNGILSESELNVLHEVKFWRSTAMLGFSAGLQQYIETHGDLALCSHNWTIDISDPEYSTGGVLDHRFSVDLMAQEIRPAMVGDDVLLVGPQPSQFGGRERWLEKPVKTVPIMVNLLPDDVTLENLGDQVILTASITHAQNDSLEWDPGEGGFLDGQGQYTDGGAARTLQTPSDPHLYPFNVIVSSISRDGLRATGLPPRTAVATIRYSDEAVLMVEPSYTCIQPGETVQFEATVTGINEYEVHWEKTEGYGSINQNGLYTSLTGGTSNAVIRASLVDREEVFDEARLDAAACNCSGDMQISGGYSWSQQTSQFAYLVSDFGELFYQFFIDIGSEEDYPLVSLSLAGTEELPAPEPGDTGRWPISFGFITESAGGWYSSWDDHPESAVFADIDEVTETSMSGTISGIAAKLNPDGSVQSQIIVNIAFRAGRWADDGWPCR